MGLTIAEFYRAEAARCRDRAEKARTPERATRWRRVAEDCLRLAAELEAAEGPVHRRGRQHPGGNQAYPAANLGHQWLIENLVLSAI